MSNFTTVITICDRPHIGGGASKIAIETAAALARIGVNSYFFSALGDPDPSLIESGVVCVNCGQNDVLNGGRLRRCPGYLEQALGNGAG